MSFKKILGLLNSSFATSASLTLGVTGGYVFYKDRERFPKMMAAYSHGRILPPLAENHFEVTYYPRPETEMILQRTLSSQFSNEYYLVNGESGSGKTRLIVEIIRDMMRESDNKGAPVYVTTMQGKSFSESLAEAVNFYFDEHISFKCFAKFALQIQSLPSQEEGNKFTRTLDAIEKSAFRYVEKYGRPVVLVIDGVDNLTNHRPATLHELQEKAKLWADTNIVKVIFVSNDERTENALQKNASAWSRAATPIHIGDLTEQQAINFLTSLRFLESDFPVSEAMSEDEAKKIVDLVGGRMHHLIAFKKDHHHGIDKETTSMDLKCREREKFLAATHVPSQVKVIKTLHSAPNKTMSLSALAEKTSSADIEALLHSNVIRIERESGKGIRVKFESRLAERVVEEFDG